MLIYLSPPPPPKKKKESNNLFPFTSLVDIATILMIYLHSLPKILSVFFGLNTFGHFWGFNVFDSCIISKLTWKRPYITIQKAI